MSKVELEGFDNSVIPKSAYAKPINSNNEMLLKISNNTGTENEELIKIKKDLEQLIESYTIYDVITTKKLKDYKEKNNYSQQSKNVINALKSMKFVCGSQNWKAIKAWHRINPTLSNTLNDFMSGELNNLIHEVKEPFNIQYVRLEEIKNYCEDNNIPYDKPIITDYIRNNLHMERAEIWHLLEHNKKCRCWKRDLILSTKE